MIIIDPKVQTIISPGKARKIEKKEKSIKFNTSNKLKATTSAQSNNSITNIDSMLFLQEVDQYAEDQKNLEEFAKKAFKILKELQFEILKGQISEVNLHNLKNVLSSSKFNIMSPELAKLYEEISLRVEIEIAKIEVNKNLKYHANNTTSEV